MGREDVSARCSAIEECYEFMLAYAGQGLSGKENSQASSQVREFLNRAVDSLSSLAEAYARAVKEENLQPAERYLAFLTVLENDARDSLASIYLVLAQATISSQLIDNLNASIHLRALLTDLFLIDEILKPQPLAAKPTITS
jgi:thioredoxin-like negative regulator of GroEL